MRHRLLATCRRFYAETPQGRGKAVLLHQVKVAFLSLCLGNRTRQWTSCHDYFASFSNNSLRILHRKELLILPTLLEHCLWSTRKDRVRGSFCAALGPPWNSAITTIFLKYLGRDDVSSGRLFCWAWTNSRLCNCNCSVVPLTLVTRIEKLEMIWHLELWS